ncbi:MAG: hypothetical protein J6U01_00415, partial [Clostridia bacterium]|nr:hypothetical protein [Clostridia bacterium]
AMMKPSAPAESAASQLTSPSTSFPVPMYASAAYANVRMARISAAYAHFFKLIMFFFLLIL